MSDLKLAEQQRAHRMADDYQAIADEFRGKSYRRWLNATQRAAAWREFAYVIAYLPDAA